MDVWELYPAWPNLLDIVAPHLPMRPATSATILDFGICCPGLLQEFADESALKRVGPSAGC